MSKKYTPATFQPTVRPSWAGTLHYIPTEERSEILEAIIKFPEETNIKSVFWEETIKPDLKEQYDKFLRICEIRGRGAKTYWGEHKLSISNTNDYQKDNLLKDKDKDKDKDKIKDKDKKPTLEEVICYCTERNNNVDANEWFNYYSANGWKVGRNPMKDWKACVRYWEQKNKSKTPLSKVNQQEDDYFEQERRKKEFFEKIGIK